MVCVLGRHAVYRPLYVVVRETEAGWVADLEPGEDCDFEWGYGDTPQEALADLDFSIGDFKASLAQRPNLSPPLLRWELPVH